MKVENYTHWRTDHLRGFVTRIAQDELEPAQRKRLRVVVKYNRQKDRGFCSGRAVLGGSWMKVMVPSQVVDRVDLAKVIAHEMAHTRGMRHDQMRGCATYRRVDGYREKYAWATTLPLERKPKPTRPSADDRRAARLAHAQEMLKAWESRKKLATTKVRYWTRRVKAVERTIAAKPEEVLV